MAGKNGKVKKTAQKSKPSSQSTLSDEFAIGKHVTAKAKHVYDQATFPAQHGTLVEWQDVNLYGTIDELKPTTAKITWMIEGEEFEGKRFIKKAYLTLVNSIPVRNVCVCVEIRAN